MVVPLKSSAVPTKRKAPAFKPPRPITKPTASSTKATARRKSAPAHPPPSVLSSDNEAIGEHSPSSASEALKIPLMIDEAPPAIPPKLLTKLLHTHFDDNKIRIGKDANALVGKYMETFVKEAIARAAMERSGAEGSGVQGRFLEVEDLEKLAPQLLLDF